MTRILITGGPRTGKTTLANRIADEYGDHVGTTVAHTDSLIATHDWSAASAEVATWLDAPGPWIIEGVALSRALRKWREAHPGEPPPVDKVIRLTEPYKSLTPGQATMAKGEETVWREIETWLHADSIGVIGCPICGGQWTTCSGHRDGPFACYENSPSASPELKQGGPYSPGIGDVPSRASGAILRASAGDTSGDGGEIAVDIQCGDCGTIGLHGCQGVPGGFGDEEP